MRRKYSEITDKKEMIRILTSSNIGRLATLDTEGYPYITPVNFVFHEGCVYFHCAPEQQEGGARIRDDFGSSRARVE